MEENQNTQELPTQDGTYIDNILDTLEIPVIENPNEREYEQIENNGEGGL